MDFLASFMYYFVKLYFTFKVETVKIAMYRHGG